MAKGLKPLHIRHCQSCGASIFWALSAGDRRTPVDAIPDRAGNLEIGWGETPPRASAAGLFTRPEARYMPHFATCPDADSWRKTPKRKNEKK